MSNTLLLRVPLFKPRFLYTSIPIPYTIIKPCLGFMGAYTTLLNPLIILWSLYHEEVGAVYKINEQFLVMV